MAMEHLLVLTQHPLFALQHGTLIIYIIFQTTTNLFVELALKHASTTNQPLHGNGTSTILLVLMQHPLVISSAESSLHNA